MGPNGANGAVAGGFPQGSRRLVLASTLPDAGDFGAADRAGTTSCWPSILHRNLSRVSNLSLCLALHAVSIHRFLLIVDGAIVASGVAGRKVLDLNLHVDSSRADPASARLPYDTTDSVAGALPSLPPLSWSGRDVDCTPPF